jgi:hypothetical protein
MSTVHLGYEVGTGAPVEIPLRHMVVTGQTQEAGKTTTLEALIARAALPAVAFVTKRGEKSFGDGRRLQPYFRERADWQFVASVLESTMREKLKFERAWIVRASKGAKTLADVQANVQRLMEATKNPMSADIYMMLNEYLSIVVPRVASIRWAHTMDLRDGLNVLDLSQRDTFPPELQGLVMRSALEWVYEHANGTVAIIPEAWEFCPQDRGSPVKLAAVELIRKGAGLKNYVWLDSQDIGGIDKELLRSCPVWLLGVQREANEIKRVLSSIPAGISKPKPADVALLEKGQFFACFGRHTIKTYVQPAWMSAEYAEAVALGADPSQVPRPPPRIPDSSIPKGVLVYTSEPPPPTIETEPEDYFMSQDAAEKLDRIIALLEAQALRPSSDGAPHSAAAAPTATQHTSTAGPAMPVDEEGLYQRFKARLAKEAPAVLKVLGKRAELDVEMELEKIETNTKSCHGMLAMLVAEGFFNESKNGSQAHKEIGRRFGYGGNSARAYEQLDVLQKQGFLTKEKDGYLAVPDMKINIVKARA